MTLRVRDTEGEVSDPQTIQIDVAPVAPPPIETWTMLLYLDADTPPGSLAPYLDRSAPLGALFRLEHVVSNPHVPVVALYDGPGARDSFRYMLRTDGTVVQEALDEANMGDPRRWSISSGGASSRRPPTTTTWRSPTMPTASMVSPGMRPARRPNI